jgi:hypothetical protein
MQTNCSNANQFPHIQIALECKIILYCCMTTTLETKQSWQRHGYECRNIFYIQAIRINTLTNCVRKYVFLLIVTYFSNTLELQEKITPEYSKWLKLQPVFFSLCFVLWNVQPFSAKSSLKCLTYHVAHIRWTYYNFFYPMTTVTFCCKVLRGSVFCQ